jgi:hypothetical protein
VPPTKWRYVLFKILMGKLEGRTITKGTLVTKVPAKTGFWRGLSQGSLRTGGSKAFNRRDRKERREIEVRKDTKKRRKNFLGVLCVLGG